MHLPFWLPHVSSFFSHYCFLFPSGSTNQPCFLLLQGFYVWCSLGLKALPMCLYLYIPYLSQLKYQLLRGNFQDIANEVKLKCRLS